MAPTKKKVPYELRNAREWDPQNAGDDYSSSSSAAEDFEAVSYSDEWGVHLTPSEGESGGKAVPSQKATPLQTTSQTDGASNPVQQKSMLRGPAAAPSSRSRRSRRQRPMFQYPQDNRAKAAFRHRRPPTDSFPLHKNVDELEPDRKRIYDMLGELGVRFGTFVRPPQAVDDKNLLMWGESRGIAKTREFLRNWLKRAEGITSAKTKPKVEHFISNNSTLPAFHKTNLKQLRKQAELQSFQQIPEKNRHFDFQGWYPWTIEDLNPKDVFGVSLEAFDSIRGVHRCHITFSDKLKCITVYGDQKHDVDAAMSRLRGAHESVLAQSSLKVSKVMVHLPSPALARKQVKLVSADRTPAKERQLAKKVARLFGPELDTDGKTKLAEESVRSSDQVTEWYKETMHGVLPNLLFYEGQLHMRVLFGRFNLRKFPLADTKDTYDLEEFCRKIKQHGVKGDLDPE